MDSRLQCSVTGLIGTYEVHPGCSFIPLLPLLALLMGKNLLTIHIPLKTSPVVWTGKPSPLQAPLPGALKVSSVATLLTLASSQMGMKFACDPKIQSHQTSAPDVLVECFQVGFLWENWESCSSKSGASECHTPGVNWGLSRDLISKVFQVRIFRVSWRKRQNISFKDAGF